MNEEPPLDPARIFEALARHDVDYLTIGGLAVGFWAYERATKDTDVVVPEDDPDNDERLREALRELHAEPLTLEAPGARALGIRWQPEIGVERWLTTGGVLDVMRAPEGAAPYPELRARSERTELFGALTRVVSRDDLIAMKLAAARIQDLLDLEALLHPQNTEPTRVRLRARDRDRLRMTDEPSELGEPVDPCELEVDKLRRVLAPTSAGEEFELHLARRARDLLQVSDQRLARLVNVTLPEIPDSLERTAMIVADAAREIEVAERLEFSLVRERDRVPVWRRRERTDLDGRLGQATDQVEQLQETAEGGIEELRHGVRTIESWWREHGKDAVEGIAARRDHYRRDREQIAERVRAAPEHPSARVTELIGERPRERRDDWDRAARTIEAYAAQHQPADEDLRLSEQAGRAQRGAWERMARAVGELGVQLRDVETPSPETGLDLGL